MKATNSSVMERMMEGQALWNVFDAVTFRLIVQMTSKADGSELYDPRINAPETGCIFQIASEEI